MYNTSIYVYILVNQSVKMCAFFNQKNYFKTNQIF